MNYKLLSIDSYNSNVGYKSVNISIFLLNICSFNKNINLLTEYSSCIKNKFNIILLTETWLTSDDNPLIYFPTYNVFQLNRLCKKKKRGSRVLALVDKHMEASIVEDLTYQIPDDIDMLTFKLIFYNVSYNYIHICLIYRRPNYNKQIFYDFIYKHLSNFNFSNLIFCGDFNINLLDKLDSHAFFNILNQLGLISILIDTPTRITNTISTQIDNFFINSLFVPESVSGTLSADISDHVPLFLNFSSNYSSNPSIKTNYLLKINVSVQNIINFNNDLAAYDWSTMKSNSGVNKAFNVFLDTFSNLYDTNCPFISHTKNKKIIIITALYGLIIKSKMLLKKKLYRDSLTLKNTVSIDRYKRYINKVNVIIRRQQNSAYNSFL